MDLDISMRSSDCPFTVHFYGALFREGDVWICMEVMECSMDKFYPIVFGNNRKMPEGNFRYYVYQYSINEHFILRYTRQDIGCCCQSTALSPLSIESYSSRCETVKHPH